MRNLHRTAVALVAATLLTSCGHDSSSYATPDAPLPVRQAAFMAVLYDEHPGMLNEDASVADVWRLATGVCGMFDSGATQLDVLTVVLTDSGWSAREAGALIGASTAAECPEFNLGG